MKKTQYTEKEMLAIYMDWQQSGLSKKAYCTQANVPCSTFHYWAKKFYLKSPSSASGFLELKLPKKDINANPLRPVVEIEYPSRVKIKFSSWPDAAWLKSLA
jgi:hypothetical protein